jgi:hypothetical protein
MAMSVLTAAIDASETLVSPGQAVVTPSGPLPKLFHHRPATNQVLAHGPGAELVVAHTQVKFMFDNPTLALAARLNQLLSPGRITSSFHKRAGSVECIDHCRTPFDCDG